MKQLLGSLFVAGLLLLTACEENNPEQKTLSNYDNGVFIINEGGFDKNNGSLSFFSNDSNVMTNFLFMAANNAPGVDDAEKVVIGDVFQSMTIIGTEAYLVANNSQKVTIINMEDLKVITTIDNLTYPRFIVEGSGSTAYLSNGNGFGSDVVFVIDTESHSITDTIPIGSGPEHMLIHNNDLFVTCSGGWSSDNRVFVINTNTKQVSDTILVGDNPLDLVLDLNNDLWVLAAGLSIYDPVTYAVISTTNARLSKVDINSKQEIDFIEFVGPLAGGSNLLATNQDGSSLYVSNNDLIEINVSDKSQTVLIPGAGWYGFDVDPSNGHLWGFKAIFGSNGNAYVYTPEGNRLYQYEVSEGPNSAIFVD